MYLSKPFRKNVAIFLAFNLGYNVYVVDRNTDDKNLCKFILNIIFLF